MIADDSVIPSERSSSHQEDLGVPYLIADVDVDLIDRFGAHQTMRGFSANTVRRRRWTLRNLTIEAGVGLDAIEERHVVAFLSRRTTATTRRSLLGDIRCFYRWGRRRAGLTVDPTVDIESIKIPQRASTPLTADELDRAFAAGDDRMKIMIALGAYAGLRVSEMANLRHVDVRLDEQLLVVRQGKGGKDRTVPLAPLLAELLATPLPLVGRPWQLGRPHGHEYVLSGIGGDSVSQRIAEHFKRCGIRRRPHDLRHAFGTAAARASNGNLVLVAQLMGHASTSTTERYIGWTPAGADVVNQLHRRAG